MPKSSKSTTKKSLPPASTPEMRENQIIAAAMDLAEERILDGTASNSLLIHYLRLGSTKERLEKDFLTKKMEHLEAKTEAIYEAKKVDEMYAKAVNAMRVYNGHASYDDELE